MITTLYCHRCKEHRQFLLIRNIEGFRIRMVWQCQKCSVMKELMVSKERYEQILKEYSKRIMGG